MPELPDLHREGRPASVEAAAKAVVRKASPPGAPAKPKIGDTIPADLVRTAEPAMPAEDGGDGASGGGAGGVGAAARPAPVVVSRADQSRP